MISIEQFRELTTGKAPLPKARALGRLAPDEMNRTEARYAARLAVQLQAGAVLWFRFASVKLRLAKNTWYNADFFVMAADGVLEVHEVKGAKATWEDDARVKIKVAAEQFPFRFLAVYPKPGRLGEWDIETFS